MSVKLRLQRHGRSKRPFFVIVAADSRAKRDGKFIERIGIYDPTTIPARIEINADAAFKWVMDGAELTNTVRAILSYKGIMYRKHLQRGVNKSAMTQEQADKLYNDWISSKESDVTDRTEKLKSENTAKKAAIVSFKREKKEEAPAVEEAPEAPEAPAADETPETPAAE